MDEFALIERFFASAGAERADVHLGVGDDAALVAAPDGHVAVFATDTVIAGVHFPLDHPAQAIGHRALAVNLSDLAAMGASPAYALLALSLPSVDVNWLASFAEGFGALARKHEVALVGGDTTRSEVLTVTVTAIGWLAGGEVPLRRKGARAGDLVAVSGTPGDAAAGLEAWREHPASAPHASLRERFAYPEPRVRCGRCLREMANAAIDVSDGLLADASKLAQASGVHLRLETQHLPLSEALVTCHGRKQAELLALTGGDDYELLFTFSPAHAASLEGVAREAGCPLTVIGEVRAQRGQGSGASVTRDGAAIDLSTAGYRHFAS